MHSAHPQTVQEHGAHHGETHSHSTHTHTTRDKIKRTSARARPRAWLPQLAPTASKKQQGACSTHQCSCTVFRARRGRRRARPHSKQAETDDTRGADRQLVPAASAGSPPPDHCRLAGVAVQAHSGRHADGMCSASSASNR